jgi:hypothetical protein
MRRWGGLGVVVGYTSRLVAASPSRPAHASIMGCRVSFGLIVCLLVGWIPFTLTWVSCAMMMRSDTVTRVSIVHAGVSFSW